MVIGDTTETPLSLVVAAALIADDQRIFVQQRAAGKQHGGLWEFPGGKVEPGEAPDVALARELREELGITVATGALRPLSFTTVSSGDRHLVLLLYCVRDWTGSLRALGAASSRWVEIEPLRQLPMPPADLPLVEVLSQALRSIRDS
jgi:8-oxo-dGTP diphosphatase